MRIPGRGPERPKFGKRGIVVPVVPPFASRAAAAAQNGYGTGGIKEKEKTADGTTRTRFSKAPQ